MFEKIRNIFGSEADSDSIWETVNVSTGEGWTSVLDRGDAAEITYYICMKILSESVGKLSLHLKDGENKKVYDNDAARLLRVRPNEYMAPTDFKALMEYHRNNHGNAYAYIQHDREGNRVGLIPLDPQQVRIIIDDRDILKSKNYVYRYGMGDKVRYFDREEIIHLKGGLSDNGISGKSVMEELAMTIRGAKASQKYLNQLYERGLTANAVIQYTGDLSVAKRKELVRGINDHVRDRDLGNIIPLPFGMSLVPLDIKLTDAQFFELKKFTGLQIAAAFGVKPNHLNNYDKSSYANSEMQNLTFYVDTLLYILTKWEEELNYKLLLREELDKGYHFEFNVATILRGDLKTQAEALNKFVTGSIYEINEARAYLGLPKIDQGDVIMVNGSYTKLDDIGRAYQGGDNDDNS